MRLLLTTDTVGGVWTFTRELAAGLLRRGSSVALVSFGRKPTSDQQAWCYAMEREHRDFLYVATEIPLEWMQNNESAYADGATLLQQVAKNYSPDLLLSSQYCYGCVPLGLPTVIVAHSDVLSWAQVCRPEGLRPSAWLDRYGELVTAGLLGADALVAPTKWMLEALRGNFRLPTETHVIANGRSIPNCPNAPERKLQAITAGRMWDEAKNLQLLSMQTLPMPLLIAGDSNLNPGTLSGSATYLGRVGEEALFTAFRASAVYLCCSRYEPFGLAPLEAALCGCAVLANDIPSLREVWAGGALYFNDAASLTMLLQMLRDSPDMLAHAQAHSYARARLYSGKRMVDRYLAVIAAAVQGRGRHAYA